jgi:hypothetical protein
MRCDGKSRAVRARGRPDGGSHRQSEREDHEGRCSGGFRCGKKDNGRKRHALVDTEGRGPVLEPHLGSIQDRGSGGSLLRVSRRIFPFIQRIFADTGYAGGKVATATSIAVELVRKKPGQVGFAVIPRR